MRRRNFRKFFIFVLVLCISIGFAVLTATLSMNASFSFTDNSFSLYFSNINVLNTSTVTSPAATITDGTTVTYSGTFNKPGDFIEFSFYIINNGTIDGQINSISTGLTTEQAQYIDYNFKYEIDNSTVNINDIIYAGQARKVIAHFEYSENIDDFIDLSSLNVNLTMHFIQPESDTTTVWNYEYLGDEQYFIVPKTGVYKIELWGAQGGTSNNNSGISYIGGKGGYVAGNITLSKGEKIYLYLGQEGICSYSGLSGNAFNGGGSGSSSSTTGLSCSGGGGTDVRINSSLNSRIMVAAGGGGSSYYPSGNTSGIGGAGGGLNGYDGVHGDATACGKGATQLSVGVSGTRNANCVLEGGFGIGSAGRDRGGDSFVHSGGGAGGYWGGGAGAGAAGSGGGGSSYISGHTGCIAVLSENSTSPRVGTNDAECTTNTTDIKCSYHYLNYRFLNTSMIDGKGYKWTTEVGNTVVGMPTHNGTGTMIGNVGDGYAKITYIG